MRNRAVALTGRLVCATAYTRQYGFSLLELLIALFVVVLITTMASLTVNSGGQDIRLEAMVRSLADVGSYALDEAQMTGVDYGLLIEEEQAAGETSYSVRWLERYIDVQRRVEEWREPASGKDVFTRQQLPPGIELELELEDAPVVELSLDEDDNQKKGEKISPQVIFYASGEATVGAINVRQVDQDDLLWRVEWDLLGRFDVLRRGEPETEDDEDE